MESVERREVDFVEVVVGGRRVLVAGVQVGQAFRTLEIVSYAKFSKLASKS